MQRWAWGLAGLVGVILFLLLSPVAYPDAQVDLNVTRQETVALSRRFLEGQGFSLEGYTASTAFTSQGDALTYLQRTQGLHESNRLAREYRLWQWEVRWFKAGEPTEYLIWIDTASPTVLGFGRYGYPETATGARLTADAARLVADQFLAQQGYDLEHWAPVASSSRGQPGRLDHHFEWQRVGVQVGEAVPKIILDLEGDQPAYLQHYLLVPEQFRREQNRVTSVGTVLSVVSSAFIFALWALALLLSIRLSMQRRANWGFGLWAGVLLMVGSVASLVNSLPLLKAQISTVLPAGYTYTMVLLTAVLTGVFSGGQALFTAVAGQGLMADLDRDGAPFFARLQAGGLLTPGFAASAVRGLCLAGVMLGYDTLFYYFGRQYLGVWSPAGSSYSNILATPAPWIYPLTVSLAAGFSEEYTFRLFGVSLTRRYLRSGLLALLLPAVVWAFAHSNYPVWTRGLELTVMGALLGWVFWKYDIETTVIAHYTYDALLVGWPLLRSGNLYYVMSGAVVTLLALVPAVLAWWASRRRTAAAAPMPAAAPFMDAPLPVEVAPPAEWAPHPADEWLDRLLTRARSNLRRLVIWGLAGFLVALALAPVLHASLAREYRVTEAEAESLARRYLQGQGFSLNGLRASRQMMTESWLDYVRTTAPDEAEALVREFGAARWNVRFYKPLDPVEYYVEVDILSGGVAAFTRYLPREAGGSRLEADAARRLAESFLRKQGIDLTDATLSVSDSTSRDQRIDHRFAWESSDPRLPDHRIRREVLVQGEQVGEFRAPYPYVPETWWREQEKQDLWAGLAGVLVALAGLGGAIAAVVYLARRQADWRKALKAGAVAAVLTVPFLAQRWPSAALSYDVETVWMAFLATESTSYILVPLLAGTAVALLFVIGDVVGRRRPASRPLAEAAPAGLAVAGLAAGAGALLALPGHWLAPDWPAMPDASGGYWQLLGLLFVPVLALALEFAFRLWLQPLFSRWFRGRLFGLVAQATLMGVVLAFLSGRMSGLSGIVDGLIYGAGYLVGGLPVVLVARTSGLLFQQGLPLLGAGIRPLAVTGYASMLLALLLPLGLWLMARHSRPTRQP